MDLSKLSPALLAKIDRTGSCWEWLGHRDRKGYGLFHPGTGNPKRAHRHVFGLVHGVVLDQKTILRHSCDNPGCVNPHHLIPGTHQDNRADCVQKRRQAKGEKNGRAKLTAEKAKELAARHAAGQGSMASLGKQYGVSAQTAFRAIKGETWND